MTDLLLINASHSFMEAHKSGKKKRRQDEFFYYPPVGMLYVAAAVEQAGFEVACIDAPAENLLVEECAEHALVYDPKIVGISATTPQARSAVQIAAELRRWASSTGIHSTRSGGTHARIDPRFVEKHGAFDWMPSAQGLHPAYWEITVPKIVKKILNGHDVKGVTNAGQLDANLDTVPFAAPHPVDNHLYRMPIYSGEFTALLSSRGCPYNCSFCSIPELSRIVRFRSTGNVQADIEQCKCSFGLKNFQLVDDIFFINKKHSYGVIDAFKDADLNWSFQTGGTWLIPAP